MRSLVVLLCLPLAAAGQQPKLIANPDAFSTLVNPNCSHCQDEAKRRAGELRADDRVLCWIRGYSDGGVIPLRFFLNPYRVISDTYGVFVYDPEAGYARGFAASLDFRFHGWRNGVMVMKHKDGTLFSCLTGLAFDGPRKGEKLKPVPTLMSDWGFWLKTYPHAVAYHMFDKYRPVELPTTAHPDSIKSRGKADTRLPGDTLVLGIAHGRQVRAYTLALLEKEGLIKDQVGEDTWHLLWHPGTRCAVAYLPVATEPKKKDAQTRKLTLSLDRGNADAPLVDAETKSRWDVAGRAVSGPLKGWTLTWLDGVMVKWFAWSAEYPATGLVRELTSDKKPSVEEKIREIAGTAEFLRRLPKKFARFEEYHPKTRQVTLSLEGEDQRSTWTLAPDAEVKIHGWWGRATQLVRGDRVWAWFRLNRQGKPTTILMLADEMSEQDIHGSGLKVVKTEAGKISVRVRGQVRTLELGTGVTAPAGTSVYFQSSAGKVRQIVDAGGFEKLRSAQKETLRKLWEKEGLPGQTAFVHLLSGEMDFLLDHEAMRWGRYLKPGDTVEVQASPPIKAVVKSVRAWRERTEVRLVVGGLEQADLLPGQRLNLKMPAPPREVQDSPFPPDLDRPRTKEERIEWFLASIYCTCGVSKDVCTGHFYTLASCNPNGCGTPNLTREWLAEKIDKGLKDRQIFEELLRDRGPTLLRPHLLP